MVIATQDSNSELVAPLRLTSYVHLLSNELPWEDRAIYSRSSALHPLLQMPWFHAVFGLKVSEELDAKQSYDTK